MKVALLPVGGGGLVWRFDVMVGMSYGGRT